MTASGLTRHSLVLEGALDAEIVDRFRALLAQRQAGRPLQYLEGTVQFGPLELAIDGRALIPRPETEQLWEIVVATVATSPAVIVDLCTGSGNLALACKYAWPAAVVYAVDVSGDAVSLARENAARTGLEVHVLEGDLFAPLPQDLRGSIDLLVANPPYVATHELATLPAEVRDHEPETALIAGPAGDEVLSRIAAEAPGWLRPGGVVACEISEFRSRQVRGEFAAFGADIRMDLAGKPRFLIGRQPSVV